MGAHVNGQANSLREACVATREVAFKRSLSCMNSFVYAQVSILGEARPTILACIRPFACVGSLMPSQVGWELKSLAAPWMVARVLFLANGSLHHVRCWRWRHMSFCRNCRSHMCHKALLTVGSHCLQYGANIHRSRNWWRWQRLVLLGVVEAYVAIGAPRNSPPMNA